MSPLEYELTSNVPALGYPEGTIVRPPVVVKLEGSATVYESAVAGATDGTLNWRVDVKPTGQVCAGAAATKTATRTKAPNGTRLSIFELRHERRGFASRWTRNTSKSAQERAR